MKKAALVLAIAITALSPAWAYMSLRSCVMINTLQGVRWVGTYCDAQGTCVKAVFTEYCPVML